MGGLEELLPLHWDRARGVSNPACCLYGDVGVTASEGSLLSGDDNGDPLLCGFNEKGGGSSDSAEESHCRYAL